MKLLTKTAIILRWILRDKVTIIACSPEAASIKDK